MPLARWFRRGLLVGAWAICVPTLAQAAPIEWLPAQSAFYDERYPYGALVPALATASFAVNGTGAAPGI